MKNYADIGTGLPPESLASNLSANIMSDSVAIERGDKIFAIVRRANQKPRSRYQQVVSPESELLFLMCRPEIRGTGVGKVFLEHLKKKYMDGQAMTLVCAEDWRKKFFMCAGFREARKNANGHYEMSCEP